jgi:hypothetical protein
MFKRFFRLFGIRKRRVNMNSRESGNMKHVVELIRRHTHPNLKAASIECQRIPAEGRIRGMWCIRSPWHNGAWIGGYYNPTRKIAVTVANPDNLDDYDDKIEQHEIAHWAEDVLGLVPPWHYAGWRRYFVHWWDMPAASVMGGDLVMCDKTHLLPFCERGDVVDVDYV